MKRIHELALLQHLLRQDRRVFTYYDKILREVYHTKWNRHLEESVVRNLTNEFPKEEERKKYKDCVLIRKTAEVNPEKHLINLNLQIDEEICTMHEYFEIFLGRMMMCRKAAELLGAKFKLTANGSKVL